MIQALFDKIIKVISKLDHIASKLNHNLLFNELSLGVLYLSKQINIIILMLPIYNADMLIV